MNITKAIAENLPETRAALRERRTKLVAELVETNKELALLETIQDVGETMIAAVA